MSEEVTARDLALQVLVNVDVNGAYANIALNKILQEYKPGRLDRAFITEIVYNTIRSLNTIDWIINKFINQSLAKQSDWIRNILRLGVYQIFYMDKVPVSAACNEAVNLSKKYGKKGQSKFVNGVLRNIIRQQQSIQFPSAEEDIIAHISLRYSHPKWLTKRFVEQFGAEQTIEIFKADNVNPPVTVRANSLRCSRQELSAMLEESGVDAEPTKYATEGLKLRAAAHLTDLAIYRQGYFQVQDESSMLSARVLNPQPGSRVLDTCSAPGGKATHLAELMENQGKIIAVDIHEHKLKLIGQSCRRLGIRIIVPELADARTVDRNYAGWADYVLADVPCSGLGVLRRRPDLRWRKKPDEIKQLPELQYAILKSAAACLKSGGSLVYSTCTINDEENIAVIKRFLKEHPDFYADDLSGYLPAKLNWQNSFKDGWVQILPSADEMDGFFIARLVRE